MKRIISVMLAAIIVLACFSGCCLKHDYLPATCEAPETCSKCGKTQGEALGHTWKDATCTEPQTCEVCAKTQGEALGHSWKDATCTEPKTCKVCGETTGSAKGHTWKDATCTEPKTCKACGETTGSAKGHSWKDATCTAPKTCKVCKATSGSAKGHSWKDATCTAPKTCKVCGATTGSAKGHSYNSSGLCKNCGAAEYSLSELQSEFLTEVFNYYKLSAFSISEAVAKKSQHSEYYDIFQGLAYKITDHPDFNSSTKLGSAWVTLIDSTKNLAWMQAYPRLCFGNSDIKFLEATDAEMKKMNTALDVIVYGN